MANLLEDWKERLQRTDEKRTKLIELNILAMTANIIAFSITTVKNIAFLSPTFVFAVSSYLLLSKMFPLGIKYNITPNFIILLKRVFCKNKQNFLPLFQIDNRIITIEEIRKDFGGETKEGWGLRLYLFTFVDFIAFILSVMGIFMFIISFMPAIQCLVDSTIPGCILAKT